MAASLLLGSLVAGLAAASPLLEARAPAVALKENTLPLERSQAAMPRPWLRESRVVDKVARAEPTALGMGSVYAYQHQVEYLTTVKAGDNSVHMIVDTGSSDTWFAHKDFKCLRRNRTPAANQTECAFGQFFVGDFPGGKITDQHFNITYGYAGGPFLNGDMGYTDLTVANVTVPKQQVGMAKLGYWNGDAKSGGLLGLGLPGLTDAFSGTEATGRDGPANMVQYNPLVTTVGQKMTPVFSMALSRNDSRSWLAFGGIPAGTKTEGEWASTPITKVNLRSGGSEYLYYQIAPQSLTWKSSTGNWTQTDPAPPEMIVDSGTTLNLFPFEMAESINQMFTPRGRLDPDSGSWYVPCNAKAPTLSINIGGKTLVTDPASMILPEVHAYATGPNGIQKLCATGIGYTNGWPYILGDTFMQELVSVFDIGPKMELRFAKMAA